MMSSKLTQLLAAGSVAIVLLISSSPTQAMSLQSHGHLFARHAHVNRDISVKRKRGKGRKCPSRPPAFSKTKAPSSKTKTTAKAKPTKAPVTNNGPYRGDKMGIAWALGEDPNLQNFKTGGPIYTWSPHLPTKTKSLGFKGVPMLWGAKQVDDFERLVKKGYADTILAFNEPNLESQSNLSPGDAAKLWRDHIEPKRALGYRTISPATTSAPSGKQWLKDMLSACKGGCTFDAVALHWYGTKSDEFIAYVEDHHKTFNKPIWVTEFAVHNFVGGRQSSKDEIFNFASKVTSFLNNADYVEAYFPFGVMHDMVGVNPSNQLMKSNGSPTDLFYTYKN
jgi:hypothetical protein